MALGDGNQVTDDKAQTPQLSTVGPSSKLLPDRDPNLIRVFDEFGRELFITKEQWRTSVLPGTLKSNWNNPDQLYTIIVGSLNDGLYADVLGAAEHLHAIDPNHGRAACIYAIALMKAKRLDQAESVLLSQMRAHGEEGYILTNLAKVFSARNEEQKAFDTLWRGLELDPNQDNGLLWYASLCREQSGAGGWSDALGRVAALPHSWRAHLWLAREALATRNLEVALGHYDEALRRIGTNIPTDALMQISGDLGNHGHLKESIELTEPHFVPQVHGLSVGNNLIKSHLDLGQLDAAKRILEQLWVLQRPDFKQTLGFWDTEISKARIARSKLPGEPQLQMSMATIEGPVWLKPGSPGSELYSSKPLNAAVVVFLGSTAEQPQKSEAKLQMADAPGRMSRALPLFLAEQAWFKTTADVKALAPVLMSEPKGLVLSGVPWPDADAVKYAQQSAAECKFVFATHIRCAVVPWTVNLRVIRCEGNEVVNEFTREFDPANSEATIRGLAEQIAQLISVLIPSELQRPSTMYSVPSGAHFAWYLLRLEQLLAVRIAAMGGMATGFLNGEREILEGNLQLCVDFPDNVGTRILFARTLLAMKRIRPDLMEEFKDRVVLLNQKKPVIEPARSALDRMFHEAFVSGDDQHAT
jgi:tetratricopeptide (TPR) repeat protein